MRPTYIPPHRRTSDSSEIEPSPLTKSIPTKHPSSPYSNLTSSQSPDSLSLNPSLLAERLTPRYPTSRLGHGDGLSLQDRLVRLSGERAFVEPARAIPVRSRHFPRRQNPENVPPSDELYDYLGEQIEVVNTKAEHPDITFEGVEMVGSYSWIGGEEPTILVPGCPRTWDDNVHVGKVKRDVDLGMTDIADENLAHLLPHLSPVEPIFHAVTPDKLHDVDIIIDRSNLRKLFHLALSHDNLSLSPPQSRRWRMTAECLGEMVVFHRWETYDRLRPFPLDSHGHNVAYKLARTTTPRDVDRQLDRCRGLVRYRFAGLVLLVSFDVDAVLSSVSPSTVHNPSYKSEHQSISLSTTRIQPTSMIPGKSLRVIPSGYPEISLESILEIKTRSLMKIIDKDIPDMYTQLVLSQTPTVYLARHVGGDFSGDRVDRLKLCDEPFVGVAAKMQGALRRVGGMLREMVNIVKARKTVGFVWDDQELRGYTMMKRMPELSRRTLDMLDEMMVLGIGSLTFDSIQKQNEEDQSDAGTLIDVDANRDDTSVFSHAASWKSDVLSDLEELFRDVHGEEAHEIDEVAGIAGL
ncbi:hypothetical protein M231_02890 [Tremella mesenterica]|uniref:Uncharacterized protein n=1 Tax=Tremella mesenterica TaxID=5217 RepID=A0A4Q1BPK3_TREME|nr:hypothetical protein M231_02890 [Tremella mesenterica]